MTFRLRKYSYFLTSLFLLVACQSKQNTKVAKFHPTSSHDYPKFYELEEDDSSLNQAIKKANQTFDDFESVLKNSVENNIKSFSDFSIKVKFDTKNGAEHVWLSEIKIEGEDYFGVLNNEPEQINSLKLGDVIKIDKNRISDWMYSENGKLIGGFTIRALRNQMNMEEKQAFDSEFALQIVD